MTASTCCLCGLDAVGEVIDPGPALGPVHFRCFADFDRRSEAEEMAEAFRGHQLAHHHLEETTP